ncbi:MAG: AEC family transporter [Pseudomonadota bacterium]
MQFQSLLESYIIVLALVGSAVWLRRRMVIAKGEEGVFPRLVTDFALPALIFANLSREPLEWRDLELALILFAAITAVMTVAWLIGRWMRLDAPSLGSVILVSGVGSTSTLGYSLIENIYGDNTDIMRQIVVMGEFGVILPLFVFGAAIARYFGAEGEGRPSLGAAIRGFFCSPIFVALVLGLLASAIGLRQDYWVVQLLNSFLQVVSDSLMFLVAFTIGLMLRPVALVQILKLFVLVSVLKLVMEPLVAIGFATALGMPDLQRDILLVEAAMPSGALATVIAARYGCDAPLASALLIGTLGLSLIAIPLISYLAL